MKDFIKGVLTAILTAIAVLAFCFGLLCLFVNFGVEAFGYEHPSITEPCGLSTEELETVLKGELKNYAQEFLWAEEDYEINALFLCAVAAAESGWGEHCFRPNNFFGFMTSREFRTPEEGIDFVAWFLRKNYLNENGKYYRGGTISDIGKIWCSDDGTWVQLVTSIYGGLINDC